MKIKSWTKSVLNRDLWKTSVEQTKTHMSCSVYQEEESSGAQEILITLYWSQGNNNDHAP
jgi:hypothetical protein